MDVTGTLLSVDFPHYTALFGHVGTEVDGTAIFIDTSNFSPIDGYVISDSTRLLPDSTFIEGTFLGRGDPIGYVPTLLAVPVPGQCNFDPTAYWSDPVNPDPPLYLMDRTYAGGHLGIDGTYRDGTWMTRWFDPIWINYSVWYVQDASNNQLIGIRDREPVRIDVGNYYTSMVVTPPTGHYEIRWRYQKDNSSYAREAVEGYFCVSAGISPDFT